MLVPPSPTALVDTPAHACAPVRPRARACVSLVQARAASDASVPRVSKDRLLVLLRAVAKEATELGKAMDAAKRMAGSAEEKEAVRQNSAALVRSDLLDMEARLCAKFDVSREDAAAALDALTAPEAADAEVLSLVVQIKKALGKHMLTKRAMLETLVAVFQRQGEAAGSIADYAVQACPDPQSPQFSSILQQLAMRVANETTLREAGIPSLDELVRAAQVHLTSDADFRAAFEDAMASGQEAVQAALGQAVQSAFMRAMMGGGM